MKTQTSRFMTMLSVAVLVAAGPAGCMKIDILPPAGPATQISFFTQPTNVASGDPIQPAVQVAVLDASGIVVNNNGEFDIAIDFGENPGGAALSGDVTARTVRGKATFNNLVITVPGNGYTLVASATGFDAKTSITFNVLAH
jgi:hypothetical protein